MSVRITVPVLVVAIFVVFGMIIPTRATSRTVRTECENPFDPVWAIMTQDRGADSMGCRGCHIGPQPRLRPWFGDTEEDVLATLETGISPDGTNVGFVPVEGGRFGSLGSVLHSCFMPFNGTCWGDDELALLDAWLINYEQ